MSDRHQAQAYPLRLPDDLKARVADAAKENGRSLNSEITARLAASFEQPEIPALKIAEKYGLGGKAFIDAVAAAVSEVVLQKIEPVCGRGRRRRRLNAQAERPRGGVAR